jgi:hypothetical protein
MARSRNIKPGFFTNDLLGEMDPLARLLFAGLWTLCDREGRVEDRPKKIKAEVLPYDNCDPDDLLQQLADKGFILRYKAGDVAVIQVLAWEKHQSPHIKESPSTLPAPDMHGASTRHAPESTRKEPEEPRNRPDDCQPNPALAHLIPDSGFLIPDSLKEPTVLVASRRPPPCPTEEIIALYHEKLPMLPRVEVLNDPRRKAASARWRDVVTDPEISKAENVKVAGLDWFAWYFERAGSSAFLTGKSKDWRADFDFLMLPKKFAKVIEGSYHKEHA